MTFYSQLLKRRHGSPQLWQRACQVPIARGVQQPQRRERARAPRRRQGALQAVGGHVDHRQARLLCPLAWQGAWWLMAGQRADNWLGYSCLLCVPSSSPSQTQTQTTHQTAGCKPGESPASASRSPTALSAAPSAAAHPAPPQPPSRPGRT